jgi:hypothetical protein
MESAENGVSPPPITIFRAGSGMPGTSTGNLPSAQRERVHFIRMWQSVKTRLKMIGHKGESYNDVVNRLLDFYDEYHQEQ